MDLSPEKPLTSDHALDIAVGIILSIVTCGLYNVYWNYREFQAMNALLGREEYRFWYWLILTIITCGLFHVYYEYKMGSDLYRILKIKGHDANPNLPFIGLGLSCFGLTIVADAIYQHEINRLVDADDAP
jgi:hypothetical protein